MKNYYLIIYLTTFYAILNPHFGNIEGKKILEKRSIMDNLNKGIKYAGKMFGINIAVDVANLVAKTFSRPKITESNSNASGGTYYDEDKGKNTFNYKENVATKFSLSSVVASLLRLVGFDVTQLQTLALNTIIGIAQAIASAVLSKTSDPFDEKVLTESNFATLNSEQSHDHQQSRFIDNSDMIDRFFQQPQSKLQDLLAKATDKDLSEHLIRMIEREEDSEHQAPCVKMLICKCAPIIWNMQKSLMKRLTNSTTVQVNEEEKAKASPVEEAKVFNVKYLFKDVPTKEVFLAQSEACYKRYANYCNITMPSYDNKTC